MLDHHLFQSRLIKNSITSRRSQYQVLIGLSIAVIGLTAFAFFLNNRCFSLYFGTINPLIAITLIVLLAALSLSVLVSRGWFSICKETNHKGLWFSAVVAVPFALVVVLIDLKAPLAKDINVQFPESLLFYPAIGYVAEIIFHVLPLTALLIFLTSLPIKITVNQVLWPCVVIASLLEPVYQARSLAGYPLWIAIYVVFHVFLFNLVQLYIFERYDFVSMYCCRLTYYALWHVIWGSIRLRLLF
ncbi:MAG TPA: hypothetical protein VJA94_25650 [Candidatus Angelobacter sp.]